MTEGTYLLTNPLGHHFIIASYEKMMTEGGKVNPLAHHFMIASYEKMMTEGGKVNTKG